MHTTGILIIKRKFKEFSYLEIGSWEGNSAFIYPKKFQNKKGCVCRYMGLIHMMISYKERTFREDLKTLKYNLE